MENYYQILGLTESASLEEIKKAYRALAKKYHPDVSNDPAAESRFIEVSEAYEFLSDEQHRSAYQQRQARKVSSDELLRRERVYKKWVEMQQEKAVMRARSHARTRYDDFIDSSIYKTAGAVNKLYTYVFLVIGVVTIVMPVYSVMNRTEEESQRHPSDWHVIFPILLGLGFIFGIYYFVFKANTHE
ncbi:MAG: hypothetical protein ACI84C_000895 [Flavobacteriales bacterium]